MRCSLAIFGRGKYNTQPRDLCLFAGYFTPAYLNNLHTSDAKTGIGFAQSGSLVIFECFAISRSTIINESIFCKTMRVLD